MQSTPTKPRVLTIVVVLALATLAFASVLLSAGGVNAELAALYETSNGIAKLGPIIAWSAGFLAFAVTPYLCRRRSFVEFVVILPIWLLIGFEFFGVATLLVLAAHIWRHLRFHDIPSLEED